MTVEATFSRIREVAARLADPEPMFRLLQGKARDRKFRRFAVACCRRVWHLLHHGQSRRAVEVAERLAEGLLRPAQAQCAAWVADREEGPHVRAPWAAFSALRCAGFDDFATAVQFAAEAVAEEGRDPRDGQALQGALVRCIFGDPFRRPRCPDAWREPAVVQLAEAVYEDRAFDRLPILADALEDAGCDNADVLAHCRSPGPHARGCWVVDLLAGRQ